MTQRFIMQYYFSQAAIRLGVCVPSTCSEYELTQVINYGKRVIQTTSVNYQLLAVINAEMGFRANVHHCRTKDDPLVIDNAQAVILLAHSCCIVVSL